MIKKIATSAIALVLIGVMTFFTACSDRGGETGETTAKPAGSETTATETTSNTDVNGYLKDDIPDGTYFGGNDVTFLIWSDHTMKEFYSSEVTGDIIGDAIHERNAIVEERLGVKLKYVETPGNDSNKDAYMKKAQIDLSSGACEYDIYGGYSRTAPIMALTGGLEELTALDYLDFEKPWWPSNLVGQCLINNRLYYCSGDISTNMLWMMIATFFDKDLIDSQGLEDPYTLVANNQWTIEKMISMTSGRYQDLNGNGAADDADFYGFSIYDINIDAFFTAAGVLTLDKDSTGNIVVSPTLSDPSVYDLIDKLGNYFTSTKDVRSVGSTSVRTVFFEKRSIFTMDRVFIVAGKDNGGTTDKIEFEYGILPNAKYSTDQENFCTNMGNPFTMYAISIGAPDAGSCAAVLECLASESYRRVTPLVFETAMKVKYASDEKSSEMYDILRSTVSFDLGRLYSNQIGDVYKTMRTQVQSNSKTFASAFKGISKTMEAGIAKISAAYFN